MDKKYPGEELQIMSSSPSAVKKLFGGAVQCSLPNDGDFMSAADLRQIPDNQEVFLHKTLKNTSIVIEMLEPLDAVFATDVDHDDDAEANNNTALLHFEEIAAANDSQSYDIDSSYKLGDLKELKMDSFRFPVEVTKGTQQVFKFQDRDDLQTVRIWLAVIRMPSFEVDLVVSLNSADEGMSEEEAERIFEGVVRTMRVTDFSLFVADDIGAGSSSEKSD